MIRRVPDHGPSRSAYLGKLRKRARSHCQSPLTKEEPWLAESCLTGSLRRRSMSSFKGPLVGAVGCFQSRHRMIKPAPYSVWNPQSAATHFCLQHNRCLYHLQLARPRDPHSRRHWCRVFPNALIAISPQLFPIDFRIHHKIRQP